MSKVRHHATGQLLEIVNVVLTDNNGTRSEPVALAKGSQVLFLKAPKFDISGIIGYTTSYTDEPQFNEPFSMTLTPLSGYQALPWNTKVIMNGTDITSDVYDSATGSISISSVTGGISIEAEAVEMSSDYEPIEYIYQNHQNNTNVWQLTYPATHLTEIEIDSQFTRRGILVGHSGFGSSGSGILTTDFVFRPRHTAAHTGYASRWGTDTTNTGSGTPPATRFIFKYGKAKLSYSNGYSSTYTDQEFTVEKNIHLFGYAGSNTSGNMVIKIYNVNHYEDGVLTHRYIPIRRKSDKYVGAYETVNKAAFKFIAPTYSIAPYVAVTRTFTNCSGTITSSAYTGTIENAVIGETWSIKISPSSGYTFTGGTTPQVEIDGVDVTSTTVTDNGDGTYTVTIVDVPDKPIEITAACVADPNAVQSNSLLSGSLVSPSNTPDEPNDLDPIDMEDM